MPARKQTDSERLIRFRTILTLCLKDVYKQVLHSCIVFFSPADAALFCFVLHCVISVISDNSPGIRAQKHAESGGGVTCNDRSCAGPGLRESKLLFQEACKIWYNKLLNYACTSVKTQQ